MMQPNLRAMLFMLIGLMLIAAGCIQTSSEPEIASTRLVPSPAPLEPPAAFNVAEGAATYSQNCAPCHGETGLGDGPTAAAFTCPMPKFADRTDTERMSDWYEITYEGNRGQTTCLMPPWNERLTPDQIWNVVAYAYSLNYAGQTEGAALVTTLPEEAPDPLWQVETSDADILNFVQRDLAQRPEAEQQAALAYIRSQVYAEGEAVAVVPEVNTTPEPGAPEATPVESTVNQNTPVPNTTAEPGAVAGETFNIGGTLVNGTVGGTLPQNLTLSLRVVGIGANGAPEELFRADATTDPAGTFSFSGVPRTDRAIGSIQTEYAGVRQLVFIDPGTPEETSTVTFTVYETTSDPANVRIGRVESYVDAVTAESASLTLQSYEFVNTGDRIYVGDENDRTLKIMMPAGAIAPQVIGSDRDETRFEQVQEGENLVFYDRTPLIPQQPERIAASYNLEYPGSMEVVQPFAFPVDEAYVYLSAERQLSLDSDMLQGTGSTFNETTNLTYEGYTLTTPPLEAGTPLQYRVAGGIEITRPESDDAPAVVDNSSAAEDQSFLQENTPLILGIGVLLVVAGGMFLFYDLQKSRIAAQAAGATPVASKGAKASKNELIAEIARLDEAYEAGKIDEASYQRQRDALKDLLRDKLE